MDILNKLDIMINEFAHLKTRISHDKHLAKYGISVFYKDVPESYDDMHPVDMIKKYAPWLLKAKLQRAQILLSDNKKYPIIFMGGTWVNGTWEKGIFETGVWKNGTWKTGTWERGVWEAGKWIKGDWESGQDADGEYHLEAPNTWGD